MQRLHTGRITSADMNDNLTLRNNADTDDGILRAKTVVITNGLTPTSTMTSGDLNVIQGTRGICLPNGQAIGFTNFGAQTLAGSIASSTSNELDVGLSLAAGKGVRLWGAVSYPDSALVFSTAGTAGAAILPSTTVIGFLDCILPNSTHGRIPVFST